MLTRCERLANHSIQEPLLRKLHWAGEPCPAGLAGLLRWRLSERLTNALLVIIISSTIVESRVRGVSADNNSRHQPTNPMLGSSQTPH